MPTGRQPRKLDDVGISDALRDLEGWARDGESLTRTFRFPRFMDGIAFVNRVAAAADAMDHHPDIDIRYTAVRVALSTHSLGGISDLDVELARQIVGLTPS